MIVVVSRIKKKMSTLEFNGTTISDPNVRLLAFADLPDKKNIGRCRDGEFSIRFGQTNQERGCTSLSTYQNR